MILAVGLLAGCSGLAASGDAPDSGGQTIDSFAACVEAGNPVAESYPRQCRSADGQLFVEEVELPPEPGAASPVAPEAPPAAGQSGDAGQGVPGSAPGNAGQAIDSFEACVQAGNPVMESYPRQCRSADGQLFVEEVDATVEASTGVVEPEDPNQIGLAPYPDEPLDTIPVEPISVTELLEHRSALNNQTVQVKGIIVATLLGEKACPPDREMCAQPSVFLADSTDPNRNPLYDLRVLVSEAEQEADYPIGETIEMQVLVQGDKTGLMAQKVE
jgi:hypothetical protein